MILLLVPNSTKPKAVQLACEAAKLLTGAGVRVFMHSQFQSCQSTCPQIELVEDLQGYAECDIVVTIGGDGTMLHTARQSMRTQKPLLGINMGQLGFLTTIESNELHKLLRLPRGEYMVENRSVLQATCGGENIGLALNDIVLFKYSPEKTIALDIYCDEIKVSSFRGDGVVFATPTGSTAYSLSAGGPVLDARLGGMVVTPICAHIVHTPPMVFADDRVLRAVPTGGPNEKIHLSCDGQPSLGLPSQQPVDICQADVTVPLIQFMDAGQLASIDTKLKGR